MARRILLLITDLQIGGTPTVVRELALRLRDERTHIEVACLSRWGPVADQLRDAGVTVTAFDAISSLQISRTVRLLRELVRNHQIDTVLSFLIHANTVAAIASRRLPDVRFLQSIQTTQPKPRWHWWVQRYVQQYAEKIVVPSVSGWSVAMHWAGVHHDRIVIIPNSVELPPPPFTCETTGMRVGFLGRLDPVKRIPDLIRAMPALDERFFLHIYGEGEDRPIIEREIARLGLGKRVKLLGSVARPQAALEEMEMLVLPSEAEGFGLVLIEAMAAGVPVVATDVMGIRDIVSDGVNGLLVPLGNPDAIAGAIRRIADSESLRHDLIDAGLKTVQERFTWDIILPQYRALLKLDEP